MPFAVRDDVPTLVVRRDFSGGQNNRVHGSRIGENQATVLTNVDLGVPSQRSKRPGTSLLEDLSNNAGLCLFGFEPDGGTNVLVAVEGTTLHTSPVSSGFTSRKSDFTTSLQTFIIKIGESGEGDVFVVGNGTDNWFRFEPDDYSTPQDLGNTSGTGNDSPPLSTVGLYYGNRFWVLKSNNLYWSDAFDTDYSTAFDTTANFYRIPVGTERALVGLREEGIFVFGQDSVWAINPSATPAATDKPVKILDRGAVANKTVVQTGDDILFLATDGVRGLFRSQQDKIQSGAAYPLSYVLKDEVESLNWGQITKASAVYFDNKYFIAVPVDASGYNNEVWVYFPASSGWMVISGWNVADWAKIRISGEERLYYIDSNDGSVYRAWTGFSDNGTAIVYTEEGRKEDFGLPHVKKLGGALKVRAQASGDYDLDVYASVDDQAYQLLGTMNLAGDAPVLPVSLPFTLADFNVVEEQFQLDFLGEFYQIRIKIEHTDTNGSDNIIVNEMELSAIPATYQNE